MLGFPVINAVLVAAGTSHKSGASIEKKRIEGLLKPQYREEDLIPDIQKARDENLMAYFLEYFCIADRIRFLYHGKNDKKRNFSKHY